MPDGSGSRRLFEEKLPLPRRIFCLHIDLLRIDRRDLAISIKDRTVDIKKFKATAGVHPAAIYAHESFSIKSRKTRCVEWVNIRP
jgi:hypothetical protein